MLTTAWRKSTFSDGGSTNCVEVAFVPDGVAVRDSKNAAGPILTFGLEAWQIIATRPASPPE